MTVTTIEDLLAIERALREDLSNPRAKEITLPKGFFPSQIGLRDVMVDSIGRLWDTTASPIKMIFDPLDFARKKGTKG